MRKSSIVDDIMSKNVVTIDEESTIRDGGELMENRGLSKIIVTRNAKPAYVLEDWKTWGEDGADKISKITQELEPVSTIISGTVVNSVRWQLEEKPIIVVMDKEDKEMIGVVTASDVQKIMWSRQK